MEKNIPTYLITAFVSGKPTEQRWAHSQEEAENAAREWIENNQNTYTGVCRLVVEVLTEVMCIDAVLGEE